MSSLMFTIAIPTYNNEATIAMAIESALNQEGGVRYEVLVVNNHSADNTASVIESFDDPKLRVVSNPETVSLFENHNICITNAKGRYILFCHSDDVLESHAITTLYQKLVARGLPKKYVVWGRSMYKDFYNNARLGGFELNQVIVGISATLIFMNGGITPSGTCFSRQTFAEIGGYLKTDTRLGPSDWTTMLYMALCGFRFEMIDEMIFVREFASTNTATVSFSDMANATDDAFHYFREKAGDEALLRVFEMSKLLSNTPFSFYYMLAKIPGFKHRVFKAIIKRTLKYPLVVVQPIFYRIIGQALRLA